MDLWELMEITAKARGAHSQQDIAKLAGVSQATVSKIKRNEGTVTVDTLQTIATSLHLTLEEVLAAAGYSDDDKRPTLKSRIITEIERIFNILPESDQEEILEIARMKANRHTQTDT